VNIFYLLDHCFLFELMLGNIYSHANKKENWTQKPVTKIRRLYANDYMDDAMQTHAESTKYYEKQ